MRQSVRAIVVKDGHILVMHRNKFGHEYYALVGGAIKLGEDDNQALMRELQEEASIVASEPRLVIVEDAGPMYGVHRIYLCDYVSGEPALAPNSEEAQIHALGKNLFEPLWLPLDDLPKINLLPSELKQTVIQGLNEGFPEKPLELTISG